MGHDARPGQLMVNGVLGKEFRYQAFKLGFGKDSFGSLFDGSRSVCLVGSFFHTFRKRVFCKSHAGMDDAHKRYIQLQLNRLKEGFACGRLMA